jgi:hypothetical protein
VVRINIRLRSGDIKRKDATVRERESEPDSLRGPGSRMRGVLRAVQKAVTLEVKVQLPLKDLLARQ